MSIRVATTNDVRQTRDLVVSLAHYYLDRSAATLPSWFSDTLTLCSFSERLASPEYQNYVYEEAGSIVGYISIKAQSHLYHLFVSEEFQGKGIARRLWTHAREHSHASQFSLRSSLQAVPIYRHFGFTESGPIEVKDGISFQPMEMDCEH